MLANGDIYWHIYTHIRMYIYIHGNIHAYMSITHVIATEYGKISIFANSNRENSNRESSWCFTQAINMGWGGRGTEWQAKGHNIEEKERLMKVTLSRKSPVHRRHHSVSPPPPTPAWASPEIFLLALPELMRIQVVVSLQHPVQGLDWRRQMGYPQLNI